MEPASPNLSPDPSANNGGYDFSRFADLPSCPPSTAAPQEGTFYAFHASDPPDGSDFLTAAQRAVYWDVEECVRRSNSIYSDLYAITKKCSDMQRRGQGLVCRYVSAGKLSHSSGLASEGRNHHYSFWVCGKTSMRKIFTERIP